jgi:signal peptidase II
LITNSSVKPAAVIVLVTVAGAFLDLLTKSIFYGMALRADSIPVIPGVLDFRAVLNRGIVWGMFAGRSNLIFILFSIIAVIAVALIFLRSGRPGWKTTLSLSFILAGTVGNLYDRVVFGAVRDFIHWYLFVDWPVFNVADIWICVGVGLFAITVLFAKEPSAAQEPPPTARKEG